MSAPGKIQPPVPDKMPARENCALLAYAVRSNSPGTAVFLTSANFTNTPTEGLPLDRNAKPYGDDFFVVFRKEGDGAVLRRRQVGRTNIIGTFVPLLH